MTQANAQAKEQEVETPETETAEVEVEATETSVAALTIAEVDVDAATFKQALELFVGTTQASMAAAQLCANKSLVQFYQHGDLQYVYDFMTVIEENAKHYVRRGAYVAWLCAHAPITVSDERKMVKDKSKDAVPLTEENITKAINKPFWEFKPETDAQVFGLLDIVKALRSLAKTRQNDKKFKAANKKAETAIDKVIELANTLENL
jgi:hypothetical protein